MFQLLLETVLGFSNSLIWLKSIRFMNSLKKSLKKENTFLVKASWLTNSGVMTWEFTEYTKGSFSVRPKHGLMEATFYRRFMSHCNLKEQQTLKSEWWKGTLVYISAELSIKTKDPRWKENCLHSESSEQSLLSSWYCTKHFRLNIHLDDS